MSASHGFVLDPTIDYSVYVPADPAPAYVPPNLPVIDYSIPNAPIYEPDANANLVAYPADTYVAPTYYDPAPVVNDGGVQIPVGYETSYDYTGDTGGYFINTGVNDPGAPPYGPAAQSAFDTGATAGALAGAGAAIATGVGALFGYGIPTGVGATLITGALSDTVKQGAQDWQYQGALEGSLGGINGTNQNQDMFDLPPVDQDPFNRLTPTFQWQGSSASDWLTNDNLSFAPVNSAPSAPIYSVPDYTMPDFLGGFGVVSYGNNYAPAVTGGSGTDFMFGNDGFGFDTFNFAA